MLPTTYAALKILPAEPSFREIPAGSAPMEDSRSQRIGWATPSQLIPIHTLPMSLDNIFRRVPLPGLDA